MRIGLRKMQHIHFAKQSYGNEVIMFLSSDYCFVSSPPPNVQHFLVFLMHTLHEHGWKLHLLAMFDFPLSVVCCPLSVVRCLLTLVCCPFRAWGQEELFLLFFDLAFFYKFSGIAKFCKAGCKLFNGGFLGVVCDGDGACVDVCLK